MISNIFIYHLYITEVIIKIRGGAQEGKIIDVEFGLNILVPKYP